MSSEPHLLRLVFAGIRDWRFMFVGPRLQPSPKVATHLAQFREPSNISKVAQMPARSWQADVMVTRRRRFPHAPTVYRKPCVIPGVRGSSRCLFKMPRCLWSPRQALPVPARYGIGTRMAQQGPRVALPDCIPSGSRVPAPAVFHHVSCLTKRDRQWLCAACSAFRS